MTAHGLGINGARIVRRLRRTADTVPPLRQASIRHLRRIHAARAAELLTTTKAQAELAIVLHLFYPELLPRLLAALPPSPVLPFDLYITTTRSAERTVQHAASGTGARILVFPNRGRDMLPFITTTRALRDLGYRYVLKLHGKRSPHRIDGTDWLSRILESLVPKTPDSLAQVMRALAAPTTGLLGPAGEYLALQVNLPANERHLRAALTRLRSAEVADGVISDHGTYGFFAGSMFWAPIDAIAPLLDGSDIALFESELAQTDGTYAHAMERLLSLIPQLDGRTMLAISPEGVRPVRPGSGAIPDWTSTLRAPQSRLWHAR